MDKATLENLFEGHLESLCSDEPDGFMEAIRVQLRVLFADIDQDADGYPDSLREALIDELSEHQPDITDNWFHLDDFADTAMFYLVSDQRNTFREVLGEPPTEDANWSVSPISHNWVYTPSDPTSPPTDPPEGEPEQWAWVEGAHGGRWMMRPSTDDNWHYQGGWKYDFSEQSSPPENPEQGSADDYHWSEPLGRWVYEPFNNPDPNYFWDEQTGDWAYDYSNPDPDHKPTHPPGGLQDPDSWVWHSGLDRWIYRTPPSSAPNYVWDAEANRYRQVFDDPDLDPGGSFEWHGQRGRWVATSPPPGDRSAWDWNPTAERWEFDFTNRSVRPPSSVANMDVDDSLQGRSVSWSWSNDLHQWVPDHGQGDHWHWHEDDTELGGHWERTPPGSTDPNYYWDDDLDEWRYDFTQPSEEFRPTDPPGGHAERYVWVPDGDDVGQGSWKMRPWDDDRFHWSHEADRFVLVPDPHVTHWERDDHWSLRWSEDGGQARWEYDYTLDAPIVAPPDARGNYYFDHGSDRWLWDDPSGSRSGAIPPPPPKVTDRYVWVEGESRWMTRPEPDRRYKYNEEAGDFEYDFSGAEPPPLHPPEEAGALEYVGGLDLWLTKPDANPHWEYDVETGEWWFDYSDRTSPPVDAPDFPPGTELYWDDLEGRWLPPAPPGEGWTWTDRSTDTGQWVRISPPGFDELVELGSHDMDPLNTRARWSWNEETREWEPINDDEATWNPDEEVWAATTPSAVDQVLDKPQPWGWVADDEAWAGPLRPLNPVDGGDSSSGGREADPGASQTAGEESVVPLGVGLSDRPDILDRIRVLTQMGPIGRVGRQVGFEQLENQAVSLVDSGTRFRSTVQDLDTGMISVKRIDHSETTADGTVLLAAAVPSPESVADPSAVDIPESGVEAAPSESPDLLTAGLVSEESTQQATDDAVAGESNQETGSESVAPGEPTQSQARDSRTTLDEQPEWELIDDRDADLVREFLSVPGVASLLDGAELEWPPEVVQYAQSSAGLTQGLSLPELGETMTADKLLEVLDSLPAQLVDQMVSTLDSQIDDLAAQLDEQPELAQELHDAGLLDLAVSSTENQSPDTGTDSASAVETPEEPEWELIDDRDADLVREFLSVPGVASLLDGAELEWPPELVNYGVVSAGTTMTADKLLEVLDSLPAQLADQMVSTLDRQIDDLAAQLDEQPELVDELVARGLLFRPRDETAEAPMPPATSPASGGREGDPAAPSGPEEGGRAGPTPSSGIAHEFLDTPGSRGPLGADSPDSALKDADWIKKYEPDGSVGSGQGITKVQADSPTEGQSDDSVKSVTSHQGEAEREKALVASDRVDTPADEAAIDAASMDEAADTTAIDIGDRSDDDESSPVGLEDVDVTIEEPAEPEDSLQPDEDPVDGL